MSVYTDGTVKRSATIVREASKNEAHRQIILGILEGRTVEAAPVVKPRKPVARKPIVTPITPVRTATVKPQPITEPMSGPARAHKPSKTQIKRNQDMLRRINIMETALGYKPSSHALLNNGKACKFNKGSYSDHYRFNLTPHFDSLVAELGA